MRKITRYVLAFFLLKCLTYIFFLKKYPNLAKQDSLTLKAKLAHRVFNDSNTEKWIDRMTGAKTTKKDNKTLKLTKLISNRTGEIYPQNITIDEKLGNEANETTYPLGVRTSTPARRVREKGIIGVKNVVGNKYRLERKVGSGGYGQVFLCTDMANGEKVAIKVNRYKTKAPGPSKEERIGDKLKNEQGFPVIRWSGVVGNFNVIVMDLLGLNLQTYFEHCNRKFSLKTVLLLADQLISRLEIIHIKGVVHNDMKPCNCMVGLNDKSNVIYLIDFGLSEYLRDRDINQIFPHCGNGFTSINTHLRIQPSQRDDLESLGYMLLLFLRGGLPWLDVSGATYRDTQSEILKRKQSIPITDLCKGCPVEFAQYLTICRSLRFNEKPDYNYLRHLFKNLYKRNNFTSDIMFDWDHSSGTCDI